MTKLTNTSETAIAITFLVMNLEALLKQLAFLFFSWFLLDRQRLFLSFDKMGFTFSAISCQSWLFPILTARKFAFYPYLVPAS
jgi:hypothetical protein